MIESERFYCSQCGNDHSVFYGTMINGAEVPTDIEVIEKPIESLIVTKEYVYILGEIDLEVNDREENISFRIWSKISTANWTQYFEEAKKGIHKMVECELLGNITFYPKVEVLHAKIGFDEASKVFKYILEGEDELSAAYKTGVNFHEYSRIFADYIHSLDLDVEEDVEYRFSDFDQLIEDFNTNVEGQYIHAWYKDEVVFQLISNCNAELFQEGNNCKELCVDIPVNEFIEEMLTNYSVEYFKNEGYQLFLLDGIEVYQKNIGIEKSILKSKIREMITVVYDVNCNDLYRLGSCLGQMHRDTINCPIVHRQQAS